ncbi:MAG: FAD-dependent oxidoreductase [Chitinivibrionales bacterium]|nr:FAD-dependent oxidoreductase [Chitinivibrionales bacterium]
MSRPSMYDAIVVGASVAGLYTSRRLAAAGWHVCVLDKRAEIGGPVRCGEASGNRAELSRFVDISDDWIAVDLAGLAVHVGNETSMVRDIPDTGVVLHRGRLEQCLADAARKHGSEIRLRCRAVSLQSPAGTEPGVVLADGSVVRGRLIVGADGPESLIGRCAGITTPLPLAHSYSAAQYRVSTDAFNDARLHFFVGRDVVENGYVWAFPKSDGEISVGAGLYGGTGTSGLTAKMYLDRFLDCRLPKARRHMLISGCAPLAVCPRRLHAGSVVVVGDAARQVNPLTAGGIMNALEAAEMLCSRLCSAGPSGDIGAAVRGYSRAWSGRPRREQKVFELLQRVYLGCDDDGLVRLLDRADRAFGGLADRSRPFRWPALELGRLFAMVLPHAWPHLHVLVG